MKWTKQTRLLLALLALAICMPAVALAQTSSSPSFEVREAQFGSGGSVESCSSGQFCALSSLGSLGVGSSSSTNFDAQAGFLTENEPFLEFVVQTASVDLGVLDPGSTATGNAIFYVRTYVDGNYSVVTLSDTLTSEGGATIDAMGTTAAPAPGTEQFGINLIDNSSPNIGANPVNVPNDNFADGEAASGYGTLNQFKYVKGDTIARSAATVGTQAVGRTDYTVSYIANISPITEAGAYQMVHDMMVVATY